MRRQGGDRLRRYEPVSDDFVLVALDRAEHHDDRNPWDEPGVYWAYFVEHLGFEVSAWGTRNLRVQIKTLIDAGLVTHTRRHARERRGGLTDDGRARATMARLARREVATTMLTISKNHAIAPHWELVPGEIDRALRRRFGSPINCLPVRPFGKGIKHRSGRYAPPITDGLRARVLASEPSLSQSELSDAIDLLLLAGPPEDLPIAGVAAPPVKPAEDFAKEQNEQVQRFLDYAADKDMRRRGVAARELIGMQDVLEAGLARANVSWPTLMELGADEVTAFMLDLPSRAAGLELMWRQFDNQQTNGSRTI